MANFSYESAFNVNENNSESSEDESAYLFAPNCLDHGQEALLKINQIKAQILLLMNDYENNLITNQKAHNSINKLINKLCKSLKNVSK
jgi:hypothetical protein